MKTLLNKKFIVALAAFLFCITSIKAQTLNPQSIIRDYKFKHNLLPHIKQNQNLKNQNQRFGIKINPYWELISAPHSSNSYLSEVKVPSFKAVWAQVFDSVSGNTKWFLRTADGGKTWRLDTIKTNENYVIGTIAPLDGNICYASMNSSDGLGGGIFKTTDGGATWKQLAKNKIFNATSFPDFVYFFDAKHGLAVGDNNGPDTATLEIYTTCDAGYTWQPVPKQNIPPTTGSAYSFIFGVYAVADSRFWFEAYDSYGNTYLYRSDDLGNHWKLVNSSIVFKYWDFAFSDKLNGVATGFNDTTSIVSATHDGGETWTPVNFSGYPMAYIAHIPGTHTFVSTSPCCIPINGGSYTINGSSYTNDYGKTWKLIDSGADAVHTNVDFLNPWVGWTGEEFGGPSGGMYKWKLHFSLDNNALADNANTSSDDAIASTKNTTTNLSAYPNPVSNDATISFSLSQSQKVTVRIFDVNGRLVKTIANTQMEAGMHQLVWDARDEKGAAVAKGLYFLKFNAGAYSETKKLSVLR